MTAGVHYVRSGGRWYVYAWRGGPRIATIDGGAKPKLSREQEKAVEDAREAAQKRGDDTLAGMIRDWRRSPEWTALAPQTRDTWQVALTRIEDKWGKLAVQLWNEPRMVGDVVDWRDSLRATPRAADIGVTVLSRLLEWGRLRARVQVNVAAGVPSLYRGADRAEILWTADDVDAFCRSALMLERPLLVDCLFLAAWTGMRLADLAAVTFAECGEQAIIRKAAKRSRGRRRRAAVPILAPLRSLIEELRTRPRVPGVETLLVNSHGRAWSADALGKRFGEVARHAKIEHVEAGEEARAKHLHDLRGTFVTHLCRAGLTDEEIANIVAWSPQNVSRIRRVYVDDAAVVVAIGRRISAAGGGGTTIITPEPVKSPVKSLGEPPYFTGKPTSRKSTESNIVKIGKVADKGFIYFIGEDDGPIKIGFSQRPRGRVANLSTASHRSLKLLALQAGDTDLEKEYHNRFSAHRIKGEWFARHQELEELIERLAADPSEF